jgi:hypothetical protein
MLAEFSLPMYCQFNTETEARAGEMTKQGLKDVIVIITFCDQF